MASRKRSYKLQYQGKEKEEGKRKDGKTTSKSGPVSISTAVTQQPKTVRDGRRLSPMSTTTMMAPGHRYQVYIYIYIYICVCAYREREREREGERERERER